METPRTSRLIVVSNRLPVTLEKTASCEWHTRPCNSGLVRALNPVLARRGGLWIGSVGEDSSDNGEARRFLTHCNDELGYKLQAVPLTREEEQGYYCGFSNTIIWPLFHDLLDRCSFNPNYWRTYCWVNRKFAKAVAQSVRAGDYVWIHDYHFMLLAAELRRLDVAARIGFFLHIPFPGPDIFSRLPWRNAILNALMMYDLLGFQTRHDVANFVSCVKALTIDVDVQSEGNVVKLGVEDRTAAAKVFSRRDLRVASLPISIDYQAFAGQAAGAEVEHQVAALRRKLPEQQVVLGIDRLDYTKGLPCKLESYRAALRRYGDLHCHITLIQHVIPSRENIPERQSLKQQIERLVSEINDEFSEPDWIPIHYHYHRLSFTQLLAYYRLADMALITSLKDGQNLVSKEYCAATVDGNGVLILSEFAGAIHELGGGALRINPFDIAGTAESVSTAFHMPRGERRSRMARLRDRICKADVFHWVHDFLDASRDIGDHGEFSGPLPTDRPVADVEFNHKPARRVG